MVGSVQYNWSPYKKWNRDIDRLLVEEDSHERMEAWHLQAEESQGLPATPATRRKE